LPEDQPTGRIDQQWIDDVLGRNRGSAPIPTAPEPKPTPRPAQPQPAPVKP